MSRIVIRTVFDDADRRAVTTINGTRVSSSPVDSATIIKASLEALVRTAEKHADKLRAVEMTVEVDD